MSRIGRKAIEIAKGASVEVKGTDIVVKGPKGELHAELMPGISVDVDGRSEEHTSELQSPQ